MMRMIVGRKRCDSVNCKYSFLLLHRCQGFVHLSDVPVRQFLELGTRKSAILAQRSTRVKNTYFFQFYRVFPEFPFLHARLVVFTELDASVFGFSLCNHL